MVTIAVEVFHNDIYEQILLRSDANDLVSWKRVCKSWYSMISSDRFIKSHLPISYNNGRNYNNKIGHRRIVMNERMSWFPYAVEYDCQLVGSSDGLILFSCYNTDVLVVNPSTKEVKRLTSTYCIPIRSPLYQLCEYTINHRNTILFWGFGYDSSIDDYKVVLGFMKERVLSTCFFVLTLKSNVWRFIGEVKYGLMNRYTIGKDTVGKVCNGIVYWYLDNQNEERVVLSFDISKEKFKETPLPDSPKYKFEWDSSLGIIKERLCLFYSTRPNFKKWVMKNSNEKTSWELVRHYEEFKMMFDCGGNWINSPDRKSFVANAHIWLSPNVCIPLSTNADYIGGPIYVPSLVSPHGNRSMKRKRQAMNHEYSRQVVWFDSLIMC